MFSRRGCEYGECLYRHVFGGCQWIREVLGGLMKLDDLTRKLSRLAQLLPSNKPGSGGLLLRAKLPTAHDLKHLASLLHIDSLRNAEDPAAVVRVLDRVRDTLLDIAETLERHDDGDKRVGGYAYENSFKKIEDRALSCTDGRYD